MCNKYLKWRFPLVVYRYIRYSVLRGVAYLIGGYKRAMRTASRGTCCTEPCVCVPLSRIEIGPLLRPGRQIVSGWMTLNTISPTAAVYARAVFGPSVYNNIRHLTRRSGDLAGRLSRIIILYYIL